VEGEEEVEESDDMDEDEAEAETKVAEEWKEKALKKKKTAPLEK